MKKIGTAFVIGAAALVAATSISAASPREDDGHGPEEHRPDRGRRGQVQDARRAREEGGPAGTLSARGKLTVFAPTDRAFANLKKSDPGLYKKVATNKKLLQSVLTYHVVGKRISPPPRPRRPRRG